MVLANNLPPLFRIKLRRDAGRVDNVAKQHGQMATLASGNFV
jgi:hypothetical protein